MKNRKKIFFYVFVLLIFSNYILESQVDSTKRYNFPINKKSSFKDNKNNLLGIFKWTLPALAIISGGGYFFFDKKADDNYQNYLSASTREQAINYRTKTKDNDQLANICGITSISSAIISIFVWLFDTNNSEDNVDEYKFILSYGRELIGYIIREDFESYQIQSKDGIITVKRDDIIRIEKEGLILFEK